MIQEIEKLAIANRGEVAVRIIRACQELGIETVLLHSEADVNSLAYRLCDEAICIGGGPASDSYLNIENVIQGALGSGADAIHPGFGFLSENPDFAQACLDHRLTFIGPSPQSMKLFGDKIKAKEMARSIGVPTIPGYLGQISQPQKLLEEAQKIGFPLMIKASKGGGGRGLRIVQGEDTFFSALESAQRESLSSFGSSEVFLEKYFDHAKHIEVQVFGLPSGKVFHLGERECSAQRRHQKVIEEAPASIPQELKEQLYQAAIKIAQSAQYVGAGTVEFLVQDNQFYFLEMNTRLQVEHPVTEMVLGVDLVKSQILVAEGKNVLWEQSQLVPQGHAIECRIYAEDPYTNLPSTGPLSACLWPIGPFRRFDTGFEAGDIISSFYDPMIAKIIVWDESRPRAIQKMKKTLQDTIIFGVTTNIDFHLALLSHMDFVSGRYHTRFIDMSFPIGLQSKPLSEQEETILKLSQEKLKEPISSNQSVSLPNPWTHFWREAQP